MRILGACSLGGAGHWRPLSVLLAAAVECGHDVLVVGPPAVRTMVELDGFSFVAGDEPPESAIAPIRERLPTAPAEEASRLGNRELFARLAATAMLPCVAGVGDRWKPDLVLREPCEYASAIVAHDLGLRSAQVAISLADVESGSLRVASPALEEHRHGLTSEIGAAPYLSRFPATVDPSPFPNTVRYREVASSDGPPLPDWWTGSTAPLVYVTLGTVLPHMSFAADQFRMVIEVLADLEVRVLIATGTFLEPARLGALPANVHVERWVDHAQVFSAAEAVICHGGSGTVFGALEAGVPLVVIPSFADQFANGRLVARHGLGEVVEPSSNGGDGDDDRRTIGRSDLPRLRDAIRAVLTSDSHRTRARAFGGDQATRPTAPEVLARLGA